MKINKNCGSIALIKLLTLTSSNLEGNISSSGGLNKINGFFKIDFLISFLFGTLRIKILFAIFFIFLDFLKFLYSLFSQTAQILI